MVTARHEGPGCRALEETLGLLPGGSWRDLGGLWSSQMCTKRRESRPCRANPPTPLFSKWLLDVNQKESHERRRDARRPCSCGVQIVTISSFSWMDHMAFRPLSVLGGGGGDEGM